MALNYTYLKYKDVHTLKNNETVAMDYEIIKNSCDANTSVSTGTILPGVTITLNFVTDGNYTINLNTDTNTDSFTVSYFQNLLKSFIADAEKLLCGCSKCNDCEECNECQDYLGAFMKAFSFASINYPLYQSYLDSITSDNLCTFTDEVVCTMINEKVFGSAYLKEPMLKILGYYYLTFYFEDYSLASNDEEHNYTTSKYKFDKIAKCIKKLGINLNSIS